MRHHTVVMMRLLVLSLLPLLVIPTKAQKREKVCEIAARVNGDTITQQTYLAELRDYRRDFSWPMLLQGKSQGEIDAELERRKPRLLDDLVDEFLLAQRGQELGFDADVELKRMREEILPGYRDHFPWLKAQLHSDLLKQGFDQESARASLRRQVLGQRAIQKEVLEPILRGITDNERRAFYDNNKELFMLPATVTLSEIFLPSGNQSESEVATRAVRLLAELRLGADFIQAVASNTPASRQSFDKRGSLGTFRWNEVKNTLAVELANLNPGDLTLQQLADGYQIIRLDARSAAVPSRYEDPETQAAVSRSLITHRLQGIRKSYIARLREKARLELCPDR